VDEIALLRKTNAELESRFGKFSQDLQAEKLALKEELDNHKFTEDSKCSTEASAFQSLCKDWQRIVDDLGTFTVDGTSTASSQAELSALLKAQA